MTEQEQQKQVSALAYHNFIETCRSPATRDVYLKSLHYFMDYQKISHMTDDQYEKLLEKDPKLIQIDVCNFITYLRKKNLSSAAVSVYVASVSKFYAMNDITLNWKKIKSFMGEHEKVAEDRPYSHSEIQTLLQNTSQRNRSIILLMCSAGLRLGAIPILRVKDLEPIDKYHIYKVNVYACSKKSKYFSFCTPEARTAIDDYFEHRKRWGERITDDSPLFRIEYNPFRITSTKSISIHTIRSFMSTLLLESGLRKVSRELDLKSKKRSNIMMNHGCRKFFETNAFKAGMDHMYLRRLMGQKSGLEDSYLKLSEEDLLEGDSKHIGYIGIIDALTIAEENKLRREVRTLKQEVTRFDRMAKEIEELKLRIGMSQH